MVILQMPTFGCKFQWMCFVKDAFIGTMRRFVKIFESLMSMMGFVVKDIDWRCVYSKRKETQHDRGTHASEIGKLIAGEQNAELNNSI